jgi:hypothetical protein
MSKINVPTFVVARADDLRRFLPLLFKAPMSANAAAEDEPSSCYPAQAMLGKREYRRASSRNPFLSLELRRTLAKLRRVRLKHRAPLMPKRCARSKPPRGVEETMLEQKLKRLFKRRFRMMRRNTRTMMRRRARRRIFVKLGKFVTQPTVNDIRSEENRSTCIPLPQTFWLPSHRCAVKRFRMTTLHRQLPREICVGTTVISPLEVEGRKRTRELPKAPSKTVKIRVAEASSAKNLHKCVRLLRSALSGTGTRALVCDISHWYFFSLAVDPPVTSDALRRIIDNSFEGITFCDGDEQAPQPWASSVVIPASAERSATAGFGYSWSQRLEGSGGAPESFSRSGASSSTSSGPPVTAFFMVARHAGPSGDLLECCTLAFEHCPEVKRTTGFTHSSLWRPCASCSQGPGVTSGYQLIGDERGVVDRFDQLCAELTSQPLSCEAQISLCATRRAIQEADGCNGNRFPLCRAIIIVHTPPSVSPTTHFSMSSRMFSAIRNGPTPRGKTGPLPSLSSSSWACKRLTSQVVAPREAVALLVDHVGSSRLGSPASSRLVPKFARSLCPSNAQQLISAVVTGRGSRLSSGDDVFWICSDDGSVEFGGVVASISFSLFHGAHVACIFIPRTSTYADILQHCATYSGRSLPSSVPPAASKRLFCIPSSMRLRTVGRYPLLERRRGPAKICCSHGAYGDLLEAMIGSTDLYEALLLHSA